jgi:hypothetical protein
VAERVPPSSIGPGKIGPGKIGRKRLGGPSAKEPFMMPKGHGVFGRIPSVDKDGDPFTRRSPNKRPNNSLF